MSNGTLVVVLVALLLAAIGLLVAWRVGMRLKRELDTPLHAVTGTRETLPADPRAMEALRQLSAEPILLKQSEGGLHFQIDHRPMVPVAALAGQTAHWAITQSAAEITQRFGARWVALVQPSGDDKVTIQRLA